MKNAVYCFVLLLVALAISGCGTNFNDVQIAKIAYDTERIKAMERVAAAQEQTKMQVAINAPAAPVNPNAGAGFAIGTDEEGRITSLYISEKIMGGNAGAVKEQFPQDADYLIAGSAGYTPKESSIAHESFGFLKDLAKFGMIGYGINQVVGQMGGDEINTSISSGGDQSVNTGSYGTASLAPTLDSYNDLSDNSNNSDNRTDYGNDDSDNRFDYNNPEDNRTNYDNQTADPTVVDPVIVQPAPIVVEPAWPPTTP